MINELAIGKTASAQSVVSDANTAVAVGSGSLNVFATPMMVALMEKAACNAIAEFLDLGQTSVGSALDIKHTAASPIHSHIVATAEITAVNGREVVFKISANDSVGEIGSGTHRRVVVDAERFMAKVENRR